MDNSSWLSIYPLCPLFLVITTFVTTFNGYLTTFLPEDPTASAFAHHVAFLAETV